VLLLLADCVCALMLENGRRIDFLQVEPLAAAAAA
jgi:hypothetical protein